MPGSLRLSYAADNSALGQYNIGDGWKDIGGYSPNYDNSPFILEVVEYGDRNQAGQDVEVHFDNFTITGPNVPRLGKWALPAILSLLLDQ